MALLNKVSFDNGIPDIESAYVRIDTISGNKDTIYFTANSYVSQDKFKLGVGYIKHESFNFAPSVSEDALNFIEQAYAYLKTLEQFKDAIDC